MAPASRFMAKPRQLAPASPDHAVRVGRGAAGSTACGAGRGHGFAKAGVRKLINSNAAGAAAALMTIEVRMSKQ